MKATFIALILGVSLQSHYFYGLELPLIAVVCATALCALVAVSCDRVPWELPVGRHAAVAAGVMVLMAWSMIGLLFYGDVPDAKRVLAFSVLVGVVLATAGVLRVVPLEHVLAAYLGFHLAFFTVQFAAYYMTGIVVDFLAPVTGEEQRVFYGTFTVPVFGLLLRPAGVFNEPGTYATYIGPAVALYDRWSTVNRSTRLLFLGSLLSLFLSFSTFGIVFGLVIVLFSRHLRFWQKSGVLALGIGLGIPYLFYRFVIRRALGADDGLGFRAVFIEESFSFIFTEPLGFIFGSSLLVLDPRAAFVGAYNDTGLLLYLMHFGGPLVTLALAMAAWPLVVRMDRPARVALAVLCLSKISMFAPIFGVLLVFITAPSWSSLNGRQPLQHGVYRRVAASAQVLSEGSRG